MAGATAGSILACGSDGYIRELQDGEDKRGATPISVGGGSNSFLDPDGEEEGDGLEVVQLALSKRGNMMFAALSNGCVRVYAYPFQAGLPPQEYHTHAGCVYNQSAMRATICR